MTVRIMIEKPPGASWYAATVTDGKQTFEFDIDAPDDFMFRSEQEIIEAISACDDDAIGLIDVAARSGDPIVLNGEPFDPIAVRATIDALKASGAMQP